jgi:hypothetical protein
MQVIGPPPDECFVLTPLRLAPFHPLHRDGVHPYQCLVAHVPHPKRNARVSDGTPATPARGALIERPAGAASRPMMAALVQAPSEKVSSSL